MPFIFVASLFFCYTVHAQNITEKETVSGISPVTIIHLLNNFSFFSNDSLQSLSCSLIPSSIGITDKNHLFYNSLKDKASKNLITRTLYDFVIVSTDPSKNKLITRTSEAGYITHSGKKIRNIEIERLNVFGVNINNPLSDNPKKFENFLNKTHINTNEQIIRKNLLFLPGDTISPLTLSDNERLLRQLPFIDDARVIIVPVSDEEADIIVLTKDVYSLGASYDYHSLKMGTLSVFEKNIFGIGHELGIEIPFDVNAPDSPGFGFHYNIDNILKSFINLNLYYLDGIGENTYGFNLNRRLVSSTTKYAGGISIRQTFTTEDLDTLLLPEPLKYNMQDFWLSRSFLIDNESVSRFIVGARYFNNNVFEKPFILPNSYYDLQKYKILLGSVAFSVQKYYKSALIYSYGRTEDIPYGSLIKFTAGKEINEFKRRAYLGAELSTGRSIKKLGYFYFNAGVSTFLNKSISEQGMFYGGTKYFSNLLSLGKNRIRNFINVDYTRGFDRYSDEFLELIHNNGFTGFKNDSVKGSQRLHIGLESVLFSPVDYYGFKFAFFGFADLSYLSGTNEVMGNGFTLTSIGLGIRIRNDNTAFSTLQVRLAFYPNPPIYSNVNHLIVSGEQLLRPNNFDPGPPSITPYR
jgi:hypothetical protein